ncbi:MAG TPA: DUF4214 domain-containing protein, partial [Pyrinomonadaceae bacterium]|nr:DUF4214 domain-containing protein [Pyrinomonadaceae bacterium]
GGSGGSSAGTSTAQFAATDVRVDEGAGACEVEVVRTGDVSVGAEVEYRTTDVSASDRSDYTAACGTLRFAPGETSKRVPLLLTDDGVAEGDEQVNLSLANPAAGCKLGEAASATITVVDNDASDASRNPADEDSFFVREHYHDFLNREADASGLQFWAGQFGECGTDLQCREVRRVNVSAAFFLSIEFKETGYFVERLYKAAFGARPTIAQFMPDTQEAGRGLVGESGWREKLEANRRAFVDGFASRAAFRQAFDALSDAQFVERLYANAGVQPSSSERDELVRALSERRETRAGVLRRVAENEEFARREFNSAFVLMQYFGYLRRDPDEGGFNFWLSKLNEFGGNFQNAEMVKAFINSDEYRKRFGV